MDSADARASQHGDGDLGDHRQVDGHPVALLDPERFQPVGEAADPFVQIAIGDLVVVGGVVALPDDRHLVAAFFQMPVEAVGRRVQNAVVIPFHM
jgi:hypothetical protein